MEATVSNSPTFTAAEPATYGSCEHQIQAVDGDGKHATDGDSSAQKQLDSQVAGEFQWTARKKVLVMLLSAVNFVTFVAFAMLTPFFPNVAYDMGASKTVVGFIFSVYPLVGLILAPLAGVLIPKLGIRITIMAGVLFAAVGQVAFEFATMFPKGTVFIIYCFVIRTIISVGGVLIDTAAFTFSAEEFPSNVATVMGILEIFTGLGFLVGPVLGGVLYTYGGFKLPFIVGGGSLMLAGIPLYFLLPAETRGSREGRASGQFHSVVRSFKTPGLWVGVSAVIAECMAMSFMDPVVSPYLKSALHLNSTDVGLLFGLLSLCYTVVTPITGKIVDTTKKYLPVFCLGFFGSAIGILLLGPAPFLTFLPAKTLWLTCVSMIVLGISGGLTFVPGMPFMLQSVRKDGLPDNLTTNAAVSGIFGCAMNIGLFVGPSLSGVLYDRTDFYWTTSVFAFYMLAEMLMLVIYGVCSWKSTSKRKQSTEREPLLNGDQGKTVSV